MKEQDMIIQVYEAIEGGWVLVIDDHVQGRSFSTRQEALVEMVFFLGLDKEI